MKIKSVILSVITLITALNAQLTIRAQHMKYRSSGKEWTVNVVAEYKLNGTIVENNILDGYYFEWHHIYGDGNDKPIIKNGKMVLLK